MKDKLGSHAAKQLRRKVLQLLTVTAETHLKPYGFGNEELAGQLGALQEEGGEPSQTATEAERGGEGSTDAAVGMTWGDYARAMVEPNDKGLFICAGDLEVQLLAIWSNVNVCIDRCKVRDNGVCTGDVQTHDKACPRDADGNLNEAEVTIHLAHTEYEFESQSPLGHYSATGPQIEQARARTTRGSTAAASASAGGVDTKEPQVCRKRKPATSQAGQNTQARKRGRRATEATKLEAQEGGEGLRTTEGAWTVTR